ncbi:hypothetical protein TL16_g04262 [Triparma laevis f. inornata]|uniref:G-patch domain-containing protein n=1 Tax=Triparma laevis f. inornata TaxID=1714386 RepID=A0A9W7A7R4_9STRA|nr:hypothetical protein TL16_g04262 [Triparma laevis f. inornata]
MPKPPPTSSSTTNSLPAEGSFAYKQLLKMGWTPGAGLGKDSQGAGMISVVKHADGVGIGAGADRGTEGWTKNDGKALDDIYGCMQSIGAPLKKIKKKRVESPMRCVKNGWGDAKGGEKSEKDKEAIFGKRREKKSKKEKKEKKEKNVKKKKKSDAKV